MAPRKSIFIGRPQITSISEWMTSLKIVPRVASRAFFASGAAAAAFRSEIFGMHKATHIGPQDADAKNSAKRRALAALVVVVLLRLCACVSAGVCERAGCLAVFVCVEAAPPTKRNRKSHRESKSSSGPNSHSDSKVLSIIILI